MKTKNNELSSDLKNSIYESIELLENNPFLNSKRYNQVRVKYIRRFPYGIHFTLEDDKVKVYGFFHMRRDPAKWLERSKK